MGGGPLPILGLAFLTAGVDILGHEHVPQPRLILSMSLSENGQHAKKEVEIGTVVSEMVGGRCRRGASHRDWSRWGGTRLRATSHDCFRKGALHGG